MEGFLRMFTIIALFSVLGLGIYWVREYRKKSFYLESIIESLTDCNREMKTTLLTGLVNRFAPVYSQENEERPLDFERFVARILRLNFGGKTSVNKASADCGVDIAHRRGSTLHLGQVKCRREDALVDYEPIAIIHSQMVKQGAAGGFVVTTSDFTSKAVKYAEGLNIDLIDGNKLVELWTYALAKRKARQNTTLGKEA